MRPLIAHAWQHVPFYRARMTAAGLTPDDLRTPEDLARLPPLTRDETRAAGAARESTVPPLPTYRKQTSGTTGEPLLFGYELDSEYWRHAIKHRAYAWAGYRLGDRALFFWGAPLPTPPPLRTRAKVAFDHALKREHYEPCAVMSEARLREVAAEIAARRPTVIVCYTQSGAELARFITRHGLRRWGTIPVICGAERLIPSDRADLEAAFGHAVFDTYGCREVMLIGAECEAHDGLHTSMENLIVEVLVREGDRYRAARPGETGEVAFTDLHNYGMPFLRYVNGDTAVAGDASPCACGRALLRLRSVEGRVSELLRDGQGAAISGIAISFLFHDLAGAVRQFQAVQHRDRSVTLRLVLHEPLPASALADVQRNGERLLRGVPFRVEVVDALPRNAAGKHRLVLVEH